MDEAKYKVSAACIAKTFYDTPGGGNPLRNDKRAIVTIAHATLRYGGNFNGGVLIWNTTLPQTYTDLVELEAYTAMHMVMVHDLPPRTTPYMVITAEPATGDALYADLYSRIGSIEHITVAPHAVSGNTLELKQAEQLYQAVQATVAGMELERNDANTSVRDLTTVQGAIQSAIALGDIAIYDKDKIFDTIVASAKQTCRTALANVMSDYSGKKAKRIDNSEDITGNSITLRHHGFREGNRVTLDGVVPTGLEQDTVYIVLNLEPYNPHRFQLADPDTGEVKGDDGQTATGMVVKSTSRSAVEEFVRTMSNDTAAQVNSVVFSTDGDYALTSYDRSPICVRWRTLTGSPLEAIGLYLHSTASNVISVAAANRSGTHTFVVAGEDGTVDIIDSDYGNMPISINAFVTTNDYQTATSMCCGNDGRWIALGSSGGRVTFIDTHTAATDPAAIAAADAAVAAANEPARVAAAAYQAASEDADAAAAAYQAASGAADDASDAADAAADDASDAADAASDASFAAEAASDIARASGDAADEAASEDADRVASATALALTRADAALADAQAQARAAAASADGLAAAARDTALAANALADVDQAAAAELATAFAAAGIFLQVDNAAGGENPITSMAFRQDGMLVACQKRNITLWPAWQNRREECATILAAAEVNSVCFSGEYLVYGCKNGDIISVDVNGVVGGMNDRVHTLEQRNTELAVAGQQLQVGQREDPDYATGIDVITTVVATAIGGSLRDFVVQAIARGFDAVLVGVDSGAPSVLAARHQTPSAAEADAAVQAADDADPSLSVFDLATKASGELKNNWSVHHIMRLIYNDLLLKLVEIEAPDKMPAVWKAQATAQIMVARYESVYDAKNARATAKSEISAYLAGIDFERNTLHSTADEILSVSARETANFIVYGTAAGAGHIEANAAGLVVKQFATGLACKATAVHPTDQIMLFGAEDPVAAATAVAAAAAAATAEAAAAAAERRSGSDSSSESDAEAAPERTSADQLAAAAYQAAYDAATTLHYYDLSSSAGEKHGLDEMFTQIVTPHMERLQSRVTPAALPPYKMPGPVEMFTDLANAVIRGIDRTNTAGLATVKFKWANALFATSLGNLVAIFDDVLPLQYVATELGVELDGLEALQELYTSALEPYPFALLGTFKLLSVPNDGIPTYTNTLTKAELSYNVAQGWIINDRSGATVWQWNNTVVVDLTSVTADGSNGGTDWTTPVDPAVAVADGRGIVFSAVENYTTDVRRVLTPITRVASDPYNLNEAVAALGRETRKKDNQIETLRSNALKRLRKFFKVSGEKKTLERHLRLSRAAVASAQDQRDQADGRTTAMEREKNEAIAKAGAAEQAEATALRVAEGANAARLIAAAETTAEITLRVQQERITRQMLGRMQMIAGDGVEASDELYFDGEVYNGKPVFVDGRDNALVFYRYSSPGYSAYWVLLALESRSVEDALAEGTGFICRASASGDAEWFPMACTGWETLGGVAATSLVPSRGFKLKHVGGGPAKYVHAKTMALNTELTTEARELQAAIYALERRLTREGAAYEVEIAQKSRAADGMQDRIAAFDVEANQHADRLKRMKRKHDADVAVLGAEIQGHIEKIVQQRQENTRQVQEITRLTSELGFATAAADAAADAAGPESAAGITKAQARLRERVKELEDQLEAAGDERDGAERTSTTADSERNAAKLDLANVTRERDQANEALEKAEGERNKFRGDLTAVRSQLDAATLTASTGTAADADLRAQLERVQAANADTQQKLRDKVDELRAEVASAGGSRGVVTTPVRRSPEGSEGSYATASSVAPSPWSQSPLRRARDARDAATGFLKDAGNDTVLNEILRRRAQRVGDLALVSPGWRDAGADILGGVFQRVDVAFGGYPLYARLKGNASARASAATAASSLVGQFLAADPPIATHLFKKDAYWYVAELPVSTDDYGAALKPPWTTSEPDTVGWWRVRDPAEIPNEITGQWKVYTGATWDPVDLEGPRPPWRTRIVVEAAINTVEHRNSSVYDSEAHGILVGLEKQAMAIDPDPFYPARFYETVNALYGLTIANKLAYLAERLGIKVVGGGFGRVQEDYQTKAAWIRECLMPYVGQTSRIPYLPEMEEQFREFARDQSLDQGDYRWYLQNLQQQGKSVAFTQDMTLLEERVYEQMKIGKTRAGLRDTAFDKYAIQLAGEVKGDWTDTVIGDSMKAKLVDGQADIATKRDADSEERQFGVSDESDTAAAAALGMGGGRAGVGGGGATPAPSRRASRTSGTDES
jgi:hypothetical protein